MAGEVTTLGDARRRLTHLTRVRDDWRAAMRDLVRAYDAEFTDPPITLRIHAFQGGMALRWRRRGRGSKAGGQSVFTLTSDHGRRIVEHLPRAAQDRMLEYDRLACNMNLHAGIATCTADRLKRYLHTLEVHAHWRQEFDGVSRHHAVG